jgi:hypothetical protein
MARRGRLPTLLTCQIQFIKWTFANAKRFSRIWQYGKRPRQAPNRLVRASHFRSYRALPVANATVPATKKVAAFAPENQNCGNLANTGIWLVCQDKSRRERSWRNGDWRSGAASVVQFGDNTKPNSRMISRKDRRRADASSDGFGHAGIARAKIVLVERVADASKNKCDADAADERFDGKIDHESARMQPNVAHA